MLTDLMGGDSWMEDLRDFVLSGLILDLVLICLVLLEVVLDDLILLRWLECVDSNKDLLARSCLGLAMSLMPKK